MMLQLRSSKEMEERFERFVNDVPGDVGVFRRIFAAYSRRMLTPQEATDLMKMLLDRWAPSRPQLVTVEKDAIKPDPLQRVILRVVDAIFAEEEQQHLVLRRIMPLAG